MSRIGVPVIVQGIAQESVQEPSALARHAQVPAEPPFVIDVLGEVAPDGGAVGLRIQRSAQGPVDLCLRIDDVQHLVGILLALSCEARRLHPQTQFEGPPTAAIPLPLTAINVGQTDDDKTFLMLEVGTTSLMFAVPPDTLTEVGQTLLALSAKETGRPS